MLVSLPLGPILTCPCSANHLGRWEEVHMEPHRDRLSIFLPGWML